MTIEFDGQSIETTDSGYLINADDWSEALATHIAQQDSVELGDRHWDVINFLRDEFLNNAGNQPNVKVSGNGRTLVYVWSRPNPKDSSQRGDLRVEFEVDFPERLSEDQQTLIQVALGAGVA